MSASRIGCRAFRTAVTLVSVALLSACVSTPPTASSEARSQLAPAGKLRVGLLLPNPQYVSKDGPPAEMQGVGVDIGRELAKQLNVSFEPVRYKTVPSLLDGAKRGEWDVAPIGYSAERTADMDFTGLYIINQSRFLVPTGSAIRSAADIDKPGHRIAGSERSLQERYISANLKRAEVVRVPTVVQAVELMKAGKAHAYIASGALMTDEWLAKWPGFRVADGGVATGGSALAVAKGRPAGTAYAKEFIEYVKASGLIQQSIERSALKHVNVAPAGVQY